jgi:hypothetical protein
MGNGVETDEQRRAKDAEEAAYRSPVVALGCDNERMRNQKFAKKWPQAKLHRHPDIDDEGPTRRDERPTRTGAGEKHVGHVVELCARG